MSHEQQPDYISFLVKHNKLLLRSMSKSNPSRIRTQKMLVQSEAKIAKFKDILPEQEFGKYALATAIIYDYFGYKENARKWLEWSQEKLSSEDSTLQMIKTIYGK